MVKIKKIQTIESHQEEVEQLLQELYQHFHSYNLEQFNNSEGSTLFLAQDQQRTVGMVTLIEYQKLGNSVYLLEDFIVSEEYRGQGIGTQLGNALIDEVTLRGGDYIDVATRRERSPALFKRLGFEDRTQTAPLHTLRKIINND